MPLLRMGYTLKNLLTRSKDKLLQYSHLHVHLDTQYSGLTVKNRSIIYLFESWAEVC